MTENVARLYTAELLSTVEESITVSEAAAKRKRHCIEEQHCHQQGDTLHCQPYLTLLSPARINPCFLLPPSHTPTTLGQPLPLQLPQSCLTGNGGGGIVFDLVYDYYFSHLVFEATAIHSTPSMCLEVQGSNPSLQKCADNYN